MDQYNHGCYLIGIECDGAQYHSSPVACDRDRLSQQILENLGWKIYRVWSTDWYRHPVESGNKLLEAIESAKTNNITGKIGLDKNVEMCQDEVMNDSDMVVSYCCTSQTETSEKLQNKIQEYRICPLCHIPTEDFMELFRFQLAQIIIEIVKFEGPIHTEELIQRIKVRFGVSSVGNNIRSKIQSVIKYTENSKNIFIKNDFLWPNFEPKDILRRRHEVLSAKIEWICDEEIKKAVSFVLNSQYSTPLEDLIVQASRVLGIKTTHKNTWERIEKLVQSEIENNELTLMPNEMIYFVE